MPSYNENVTFDAFQTVTINETATDTTTINNSVILLNVMRIFFGLAAIAGNSLIIICVIQYRSLRTITNILIANLAVADFLNGLAWVISSVLTFMYCVKIPSGLFIAESTISFIALFPFLGNNFAILLIALERFICIHYTLRYYSIVTSLRMAFILGLAWILCAVCFAFPMEGVQKTIVILGSLLCMMGTVALHSYVGFVACKKSRQVTPQPQVMDGRTAEALDNQQAQWKITKFLAFVLGVYSVSILLSAIVYVFTVHGRINSCDPILLPVFFAVAIWGFNNCVNPFLYVWKSEKFRTCVKKRLRLQ